jgi:hypothetical protein
VDGREPETKHREDYGSGPEEMTDECFFTLFFFVKLSWKIHFWHNYTHIPSPVHMAIDK